MKITINKPFGRQAILVSKDLVKVTTFLLKHKVRNWVFDRTISIFKAGSPIITIRHTYKKRGNHISYITK